VWHINRLCWIWLYDRVNIVCRTYGDRPPTPQLIILETSDFWRSLSWHVNINSSSILIKNDDIFVERRRCMSCWEIQHSTSKIIKIYHFKFDMVIITIIFVFDGQDAGKSALVSSDKFFVSASNHQLEWELDFCEESWFWLCKRTCRFVQQPSFSFSSFFSIFGKSEKTVPLTVSAEVVPQILKNLENPTSFI
jgi:hypothetical protein